MKKDLLSELDRLKKKLGDTEYHIDSLSRIVANTKAERAQIIDQINKLLKSPYDHLALVDENFARTRTGENVLRRQVEGISRRISFERRRLRIEAITNAERSGSVEIEFLPEVKKFLVKVYKKNILIDEFCCPKWNRLKIKAVIESTGRKTIPWREIEAGERRVVFAPLNPYYLDSISMPDNVRVIRSTRSAKTP